MNKQYHLIGIGGIGMGALALLLLAKGRRVSGSDLKENKLILDLKHKGARVHIGHDARNINGAQYVIYSSAVSEDNPELKGARRKGVQVIRRAELLADLMKEHIGITVAGAHGKTTTTSMTAHLLMKAGMNPTVAVGGIVHGLATNAKLGEGKFFVAEVDESDGSFLSFSPDFSLITNIDFEHVDFYHSWKNILKAYADFIECTKPQGLVIACGDDEELIKLLKKGKRRFKTYGTNEDNAVRACNIIFDGFRSNYDCVLQGKSLGTIELFVPGKHNVINSLACVTLGLELGIDFSTIQATLKDFRSVERRFQLIGEAKGVVVVDDYGHHPTEIASTLKAAALVKKKRLIVVFQPHRYTRLKFLMKEFAQSLLECDHLILTDVYAASEKPIDGVNSQKLCEEIEKLAKNKVIYQKKEDIIPYLLSIVKDGDLVLTLGAGDVTRLSRELLENFKGAAAALPKEMSNHGP